MKTLAQAALELAARWEDSARASQWLRDRAAELRDMVADAKTTASERELDRLIRVEQAARLLLRWTFDDCDSEVQLDVTTLEAQLRLLDAQRELDGRRSSSPGVHRVLGSTDDDPLPPDTDR